MAAREEQKAGRKRNAIELPPGATCKGRGEMGVGVGRSREEGKERRQRDKGENRGGRRDHAGQAATRTERGWRGLSRSGARPCPL